MESSRSPFQVLIFPFRRMQDRIECLVLKRSDLGIWQGVAGGGENEESPKEAASRELFEETGLNGSRLVQLDSLAYLPVVDVTGEFTWGRDTLVIPEYAFAYEAQPGESVNLSGEHLELRWEEYEVDRSLLKWDSNNTALWELLERIKNGML
ncbi:MAG: NUDIX hydrolase [Coriobacteriales bacterium]